MSPLAHVVQVAIVGGALAGGLVFFAGQALVDYLTGATRPAAVVDQDDEAAPEFGEYLDILDDEVDLPEQTEPDFGAEWDRARDCDLDYRAGVA